MKIKFRGKVLISLIITSLLILPTISHAEKQKIKVVVENASIRLKPDIGSEIIGNPPLGSVFEVEKKVGEWYEIRFPSKVGVLITGYIHEMFVEVEKEMPKTEKKVPKKPPEFEVSGKAKMINIKASGLFYLIQAGYDYQISIPYLGESLTIIDSVENDNAFGFDLGFGVFVIKNIEITGSVNYFSKGLTGNYGFSLPNVYLWNDIAHDETSANPTIKETIFNFGINFHPLVTGKLRPYLGGGASYINGKMDLVKEVKYAETFYSDLTHSIEITSVEFTETSINKLGFNLRAGINFEVTDNVFVFAEGRYIIAKTEVPHPMVSQYLEEEKLDIDLGGGSFNLGIKVFF